MSFRKGIEFIRHNFLPKRVSISRTIRVRFVKSSKNRKKNDNHGDGQMVLLPYWSDEVHGKARECVMQQKNS
jgi:hypothetical protein